MQDEIEYKLKPPLMNAELNALFSTGWPSWQTEPDSSDWQPVLARSLVYVGAYASSALIGFVNVAWDGRDHAFLLDPRVRPEYRNRGIGTELVRRAKGASAEAGCKWLHVDYTAELARFYAACGFEPTQAGLIRLR